jgi:hypothetical protein
MFQYIFIIFAIINLLIFITGLVIYSLTLQWIDKLERSKCKCSEDYKRDFIKYFLYFYLAYIIINIIAVIAIAIYSFRKTTTNQYILIINTAMKYLSRFILPILFVVNIIFSILYITQLKKLHVKLECECSKDIRAEIYYYWTIFLASFIGLVLIGMGLVFIFFKIVK